VGDRIPNRQSYLLMNSSKLSQYGLRGVPFRFIMKQMNWKLATALVLLSAIWRPAPARSQDRINADPSVQKPAERQLYLLTGFPVQNCCQWSVTSDLLAVDGKNGLTPVNIEHVADGSAFITANHDRKLVIVGGYSSAVLIPMDAPRQMRTFRNPGLNICMQGDKPVVLTCSITSDGRLSGIGLDQASSSERVLPVEEPWQVRGEGAWGPSDLPGSPKSPLAWVYLHLKDGRFFLDSKPGAVDLGISAPADLNPGDLFTLAINNDEMVVIQAGRSGERLLGTPETSTFFIYDKASRNWRKKTFPSLYIRAFGPWIAMPKLVRRRGIDGQGELDLVSPGPEFRQKVLTPQERERDQARVDLLFQGNTFQFPGELSLYNIRTDQKYAIETGQGDSEILLIDGETVYYRVNDSVYKARIGAAAINDPEKIVSGGNTQLVHWAFLGPPLSDK
jgi:hypothetical protein